MGKLCTYTYTFLEIPDVAVTLDANCSVIGLPNGRVLAAFV